MAICISALKRVKSSIENRFGQKTFCFGTVGLASQIFTEVSAQYQYNPFIIRSLSSHLPSNI